MRTLGYPYPFRAVPWVKICEFLGGMAANHPEFRHMAAIADSVVISGSTDLLAGTTSMHDLIVVSTPIPEPPYDVVAVRAPGSIVSPKTGEVLIEHLSVTGHNDRIARPTVEAVPLFWRFIMEKYGVGPVRPPTSSGTASR
jgi:hypothetical protein